MVDAVTGLPRLLDLPGKGVNRLLLPWKAGDRVEEMVKKGGCQTQRSL